MRPFSDIFFHCGFEYRLGSALFATVEQQQTRAKRISHLSWEKVKLYIKPFSGLDWKQGIIYLDFYSNTYLRAKRARFICFKNKIFES